MTDFKVGDVIEVSLSSTEHILGSHKNTVKSFKAKVGAISTNGIELISTATTPMFEQKKSVGFGSVGFSLNKITLE